METSLEQLLDKYGVTTQQRNRCLVVCQPKQKNHITLVQWFGNKKVLPTEFEIDRVRDNHRLVPYSKDTFGVYAATGYQTHSDQGHLNVNFDGDRHLLGHPLCIVKFNREEYEKTKDEYDKFWEWRTNRNASRLKMEEEFFFDGKHAMHLVRLLRMGVEILRDGQVIVKRPDAEELLAIRNGSWTYEELIKYAETMDEEVRGVWYKKTELPKKPDIKFAAKLLMETQEMVWREND